jgi:hypothetical protein
MKTIPERHQEATNWADKVSKRARFPVDTVKDLLGALGDDNTEVDYSGRKMSLGQIKKMLPNDMFPVESREDLIAKIGYLETRAERQEAPSVGEQMKEPPSDAGEPPAFPEADFKGRKGGMPGVRGYGKGGEDHVGAGA